MTEFHLVPDEVHSSGSFALPRSHAGVPTGGLCHSTRLRSGTPCPTAFATSARRVLQALPGLLYLTTYPNPMSIIARMMAQRQFRSRRTGCSGWTRIALVAGASRALRKPFYNRRCRHASMRAFNVITQGNLHVNTFLDENFFFPPLAK